MEHRELIKERMLEQAARMWGVEGVYDESSFDPLVGMLISALASEGEAIYQEMDQVQDRVAKKLMNQLIPHVHGGVQPGHGVAVIRASEAMASLPTFYKFVARVRGDEQGARELHFISLQKLSLFSGGIKFMVSKAGCFQMADYRYRVKTAVDDVKQMEVGEKELLLGLELPEGGDLERFHLFFDFKENNIGRENFFHYLKYAQFFLNDEPIESEIGFFKGDDEEISVEWGNSEGEFKGLRDRVLRYYDQQFVFFKRKSKDPVKFQSIGSADDAVSICWVKVVFSEGFDARVLSSVNCFANASPLVNLTQREKVFRGGDNLSVISIQDEEGFYALDSVQGDEGEKYKEYGTQGGVEWNKGSFLLRREGVAGLSAENASEAINYLVGKLRNESAAFSILDNGNFSDDLKVLGQIVSRLELSLTRKKRYHSPVYMFLKYKEVAEAIFVKYYTTAGKNLGGIKPNTPLQAFEGSFVQQTGGYFITPIAGARDVLNSDEQFYHNRYMMLSGGRVVTNQDIKSALFHFFGKRLCKVEIEKGVFESKEVNTGFARTIDIKVSIDILAGGEDTIEFEGRELLQELEERGSHIYPYRLFINGVQIFR